MPQLTDSMFKVVLVGAIFLTLWAGFNILFIGGELGDTTDRPLSDIINQSWAIFTQPELIIMNALFGIIGIVTALIVARELLPV